MWKIEDLANKGFKIFMCNYNQLQIPGWYHM